MSFSHQIHPVVRIVSQVSHCDYRRKKETLSQMLLFLWGCYDICIIRLPQQSIVYEVLCKKDELKKSTLILTSVELRQETKNTCTL